MSTKEEERLVNALSAGLTWLFAEDVKEGALLRDRQFTHKDFHLRVRVRVKLLLYTAFGRGTVGVTFVLAAPRYSDCLHMGREMLDNPLAHEEVLKLKELVNEASGAMVEDVRGGHGHGEVTFSLDKFAGKKVREAFNRYSDGCQEHMKVGCNCGWEKEGLYLLTEPEGWI